MKHGTMDMNLVAVKFMSFFPRFIRGPTHITQTDVWVSRGDTLSLFKRRGDLIVVIGVGRRFKSRVSLCVCEADLGTLSRVKLT